MVGCNVLKLFLFDIEFVWFEYVLKIDLVSLLVCICINLFDWIY